MGNNMKKIVNLLLKKQQKSEKFYNLSDTPLSESDNNDIIEENSYKHYPFDSDFWKIHEPEYGVEPQPRKENSKIKILPEQNHVHNYLLNREMLKYNDIDKQCTEPQSDLQPVNSESLSSDSLKSCSNYKNVSVCEQKEKCQSKENKKTNKNIYVINISNSKNFHIGSQKTIYYKNNNLPKVPVQDYKAQTCIDSSCPQIKTNWSFLLDCEMKLSDDHITLICEHLIVQWEKFVKNLGFKETFLELLQSRNDYNRSFVIYDALQKYIKLYPNTSLGFIVNLLSEIQQLAVIEKLALEIKTV